MFGKMIEQRFQRVQDSFSELTESARESISRWILLLPQVGGLSIEIDGQVILVVTPESRLGAELIGCFVGDEIQNETIASIL
jgi:hypothetical protein